MSIISLVAADDHEVFLDGLSTLIEITPDLKLLGHGRNAAELIQLVEQYQPAIALMDLYMPGEGPEKTIDALESVSPQTKIIVLTMLHAPERAQQLFSLGLSGYVLKDDAFDEIHSAIQNVYDGEQYLSKKLMSAKTGNNKSLTHKELEVLQLISTGCSNKEIARELAITERTVRFHGSNICYKLQAQGRSHAVAIAIRLHLI